MGLIPDNVSEGISSAKNFVKSKVSEGAEAVKDTVSGIQPYVVDETKSLVRGGQDFLIGASGALNPMVKYNVSPKELYSKFGVKTPNNWLFNKGVQDQGFDAMQAMTRTRGTDWDPRTQSGEQRAYDIANVGITIPSIVSGGATLKAGKEAATKIFPVIRSTGKLVEVTPKAVHGASKFLREAAKPKNWKIGYTFKDSAHGPKTVLKKGLINPSAETAYAKANPALRNFTKHVHSLKNVVKSQSKRAWMNDIRDVRKAATYAGSTAAERLWDAKETGKSRRRGKGAKHKFSPNPHRR